MEKKQEFKELIDQYCQFQAQSPSPFHVVDELKSSLTKAGFCELDLSDEWQLAPSGAYFTVHHDRKTLIAFRVGSEAPQKVGFNISCAHTDSPCLRFRLNPFSHHENLQSVVSQTHGGLIARSWLDRPLLVAGMVHHLVRNQGKIVLDPSTGLPQVKTSLVRSHKALAVIPDLAIHLDRDKNSQGKIDFETMLAAFFGSAAEADQNLSKFWAALNIDPKVIDGFELYLAPMTPHEIVGADDSFIVGPRHDDLAMVFAMLSGLTQKLELPSSRTAVAGFFDAEETGSETSSGARSSYFTSVLKRICNAHPDKVSRLDSDQAFAKSYLISADMAHGFHPGHPQKFDDHHRVFLNQGLVIKENANDRYATSAQSAAIFRGLCELAEVPTQNYIHRQDIGCGSTIGPCLAAQLGCLAIDIGAPMWSMHSTAETMGTRDLHYAKSLMHKFFSSPPSAQ